MEPEKDEVNIEEELKTRFLELPEAVQDAITSADVDSRLRELSVTHKLHLDQGQKLENEVMLALLGIQSLEKLEENIKNEVGVPAETASALANDIAEKIFLPIREELQRELPPEGEMEQPVANQPVAGSLEPVANAANTVPSQQATSSPVLPATPPAPVKTEKSIRAPISESYMSQIPSHERKAIDGDPYRESIV